MTTKSHRPAETKPRTLISSIVTLVVMVVALGAASGCATVAPYERGKLAHPTMVASDLTGFGESHLRAISEGATGGSGGTGSGCGCN
ncbi:MAG: DUF4266 domain-containing protein [Byssovorax sp.]